MRFPSAETEGESKPAEPTPIVRRVPSVVSMIMSVVRSPVRTTTATWRLSGNQLGAVSPGPPAREWAGGAGRIGHDNEGSYAVDSQLQAVGRKPHPAIGGAIPELFRL